MKLFIVLILIHLLTLPLSGCSEDFGLNTGKQVVGYDTRVMFFADDPVFEISPKVDRYTQAGWEIKSSRRAYEQDALGTRWGYEYVLQKPIYK